MASPCRYARSQTLVHSTESQVVTAVVAFEPSGLARYCAASSIDLPLMPASIVSTFFFTASGEPFFSSLIDASLDLRASPPAVAAPAKNVAQAPASSPHFAASNFTAATPLEALLAVVTGVGSAVL